MAMQHQNMARLKKGTVFHHYLIISVHEALLFIY